MTDDDLTDDQIHAELLKAGITDSRIETAYLRVRNALENRRVKDELDEYARRIGFELGAAPKCPKCGASMVHTRLQGFVCPSGRC